MKIRPEQLMSIVHTSQTVFESRVHRLKPEGALGSALQASRRVDWRFLLPDPNLGQVAYVGSARGALVESLQLFSASLTVLGISRMQIPPTARYDVVVSTAPSYETLEWAAELVRSGGFIYFEAGWLLTLRGLRSRFGNKSTAQAPWLGFGADYVAALEKLGFEDVQANWHWPDFESCTRIIPLANREALLQAFLPPHYGVHAWLKAEFGLWLLHLGVLSRLVPCFSIVGRKRESD